MKTITKLLGQPNPMGGPSLEVMELGLHLIQTLDRRPMAVDLGAGSGRNSYFLAGLGFEVLAIERKHEHVRQFRSLLRASGFNAQVSQRDAAKFVPEQLLDLCLCLGILHFLKTTDAAALVQRLKLATSPSGFHVLTIADRRYNLERQNTLGIQGYLGSVASEHLRDWYSDWIVVAHECYVKVDDHLAGALDEHCIEKFILAPRAPSISNFPRVWSIGQDAPGLADAELRQLVCSRMKREQVIELLGKPDVEFGSIAIDSQLSLMPRSRHGFSLSVAFWGPLKLYFENQTVVAFARYRSCFAHSFSSPPLTILA